MSPKRTNATLQSASYFSSKTNRESTSVFFFTFFAVMSACLSHPCLHGGTCVDTYFLHNNGIESLSMYAGPSIIDTEQNGMSYICKCLSPYAGHNCEGNNETNKLQCLFFWSCRIGREQSGIHFHFERE